MPVYRAHNMIMFPGEEGLDVGALNVPLHAVDEVLLQLTHLQAKSKTWTLFRWCHDKPCARVKCVGRITGIFKRKSYLTTGLDVSKCLVEIEIYVK